MLENEIQEILLEANTWGWPKDLIVKKVTEKLQISEEKALYIINQMISQ